MTGEAELLGEWRAVGKSFYCRCVGCWGWEGVAGEGGWWRAVREEIGGGGAVSAVELLEGGALRSLGEESRRTAGGG